MQGIDTDPDRSEVRLDDALIQPVYQAGLIRFHKDRLLFSNPADVKPVRMTVKMSRHEGETWPVARLVHEGPAAYSSLAQLEDGRMGLHDERGDKGAYELITFARFDRGRLEGGDMKHVQPRRSSGASRSRTNRMRAQRKASVWCGPSSTRGCHCAGAGVESR